MIILFSLGKTAEGERLPEYVLYGRDDPADDLAGGDLLAVLTLAGPRQPPSTGPGPASNRCPVNTDSRSVPTGAGLRGLTFTTGRDTKLSSGLLGNVFWLEGLTTGTGAEVWHRLRSIARVAVVVNGERKLLAISAVAELGRLSLTRVQAVLQNPLPQQGVVPYRVPDVSEKPSSPSISQAADPLTGNLLHPLQQGGPPYGVPDISHPIQHSSKVPKQPALRFTVAAAQQT